MEKGVILIMSRECYQQTVVQASQVLGYAKFFDTVDRYQLRISIDQGKDVIKYAVERFPYTYRQRMQLVQPDSSTEFPLEKDFFNDIEPFSYEERNPRYLIEEIKDYDY